MTDIVLANLVSITDRTCTHCNKSYQIPDEPSEQKSAALHRLRTHKYNCKKRKRETNRSISSLNTTQLQNELNSAGSLLQISLQLSLKSLCINDVEYEEICSYDYMVPLKHEYQQLYQECISSVLTRALWSNGQSDTGPRMLHCVRRKLVLDTIKLFWMMNRYGSQCTECKRKISTPADLGNFHCDHIDPKSKRVCIAQISRNKSSPNSLMKELEKCQLLCSACHMEKTRKENSIRYTAQADENININSNPNNIDNNAPDFNNHSTDGGSNEYCATSFRKPQRAVRIHSKTLGIRRSHRKSY
jgi:hypothetical protein